MSLKSKVKKHHKKLKSLLKKDFVLCDCYTLSEDTSRLGGSEGFFIISEYRKSRGFIDTNGYTHQIAFPIQTLPSLNKYLYEPLPNLKRVLK